jgi:hypothetical protein
MKIVEKFAIAMVVMVFGMVERPAQADSLSASYFSMSESDPDVANGWGLGTVSAVVGAGLGVDGLPVASAYGIAHLHDVDPTTDEIEWWSPTLNPFVSVLNNPVYPSTILLPFTDDNMYTNTTVLGANGDDASAFLTAAFTGTFTLTADSAVTIPTVCSDDDEFVYLSGGVFGNGTNVLDNGGIHGLSCNDVNNNASLLTDVAPGMYTLSVFYDDREQTNAAFSIGLDTLSLTPVATPEPGTIALLAAGLGIMGLPLCRRKRA